MDEKKSCKSAEGLETSLSYFEAQAPLSFPPCLNIKSKGGWAAGRRCVKVVSPPAGTESRARQFRADGGGGGVGMRVAWRGGGGGECLHVAADVYPEFIMAMFSDVCMSPSVYPVCLVMHGAVQVSCLSCLSSDAVDRYPVYPVCV